METRMVITIMGKKQEGKPLVMDLIYVPLNCSTSDQEKLKRTIESSKDDPSIVMDLVINNSSILHPPSFQAALDTLRNNIEQCESIEVQFMSKVEAEKNQQTKEKRHFSYDPSMN